MSKSGSGYWQERSRQQAARTPTPGYREEKLERLQDSNMYQDNNSSSNLVIKQGKIS